METVNKFHSNLICLLINEMYIILVNKEDLLLKFKHGRNIV